MRLSHKRLYEGERFPWGYAPSYMDFIGDHVVAYPIGLHWIVRWFRALYFWVLRSGWPEKWDKPYRKAIHEREKEAFDKGDKFGRAQGARGSHHRWKTAALEALSNADPKNEAELMAVWNTFVDMFQAAGDEDALEKMRSTLRVVLEDKPNGHGG